MSKQLSVRIDDELDALIKAEKEKLPYEVDTSEIVRTALREHLSGNALAAATRPTAD